MWPILSFLLNDIINFFRIHLNFFNFFYVFEHFSWQFWKTNVKLRILDMILYQDFISHAKKKAQIYFF